jgi:hypothetical protein
MSLESFYDPQATNRRQGGLSVRTHPPPTYPTSYWSAGSHIGTLASRNTQKKSRCSYLLYKKKMHKRLFIDTKSLTSHNFKTFYEE